ncbi:MAG: hypothetical protein LBT20_03150 [Clostridiales bacterium]|jgi:hypothetical protein|nr:hypothetical protein [Clostridiales bacterium]
MGLSYSDYIRNEIAQKDWDCLFTAEEICAKTAERFGADKKKLKYTVNVILNRMTGTELLGYQKGVYYRPRKTLFGLVPINRAEAVYKEYVENENGVIGYVTGPTLFQKMGFTTQIPKYRFFASNKAVREKVIESANIVLRPPKTVVNAENYRYLQLLDIIDNKDGVVFETDDAEERYCEVIQKYALDFGRLIGTAKRYYSQRVVDALVGVAVRSVL